MDTKIPCKICLLEEAGRLDVKAMIMDNIAKLKPEHLADDELYQSRLSKCKNCEHLYQGTCAKCGCYVELRAAVSNNHCPHSKKYW